jgi:hypothetical protein
MVKKRCEFELIEDGITWKCKNESCGAIMRCRDVCTTHEKRLFDDNKRRHVKGIDIPNSCEVLKGDKTSLNLLQSDGGVKYKDYKDAKKKNKRYEDDPQVIISTNKLNIKDVNTTKFIKA